MNNIIEEDIHSILKSDWQLFFNSSILVTGANGFVPSYFIYFFTALNKLHDANIEIYALCRNKNKAEEKFKKELEEGSIQLIIQDLSEPLGEMPKVDFIIHAASQASPKYYKIDPVGTSLPNILGTNSLLQLARECKVKSFLYFSSSEVYGQIPAEDQPISEKVIGKVDSLELRSCYSESKRMGENLCISWFNQYNIPVKMIRLFHVYGPGMALDDGRVYADFVANILNNQNIELKSDGLAQRTFCYLSDAIHAVLQVIRDGSNGEAYNVGNLSCETKIVDLAETLVSLFPEKKLQVLRQVQDSKYLPSKVNRNAPDTLKIMELGWSPKIDIKEGFKRTVLSYSN